MIFLAILFLGLIVYVIVKTVMYINVYRRISINGIKTYAEVVGFRTYRYSLFLKNAAVPILSFNTEDLQQIRDIPIHSIFVEIVAYKMNKEYSIKYDNNNPKQFIIAKKGEIFTSIILLILGLSYIYWFLIIYIPPYLRGVL